MKMKEEIPVASLLTLLQCPTCGSELAEGPESLICKDSSCLTEYPIVGGVPVLINESNSFVSIRQVVEQAGSPSDSDSNDDLKAKLRRIWPNTSANLRARQNFSDVRAKLTKRGGKRRVLIVGGGELGTGLDQIVNDPAFETVETDIYLGPRTMVICDAHDLPFEDGVFDAVVIQGVICWLVDPKRAVDEIFRVLNDSGLVYSETPFMQGVTGGRFDFVRYTNSGQQALFEKFKEHSSGPVSGPGMSLAWAYKYFLLSFATSRRMRSYLNAFADLTGFWLKYFDRYLINKPGVYDSAAGFYYLGEKSATPTDRRQIVEGYGGGFR
jgi:SAM-dependent methyltransferase/uncharacterized protein YbaR (Trm112 family)